MILTLEIPDSLRNQSNLVNELREELRATQEKLRDAKQAAENYKAASEMRAIPIEALKLPTGDVVVVGSTVSACVRRVGKRQMYWYAARVIDIKDCRAMVELELHSGEKALLSPCSLRLRAASQTPENNQE